MPFARKTNFNRAISLFLRFPVSRENPQDGFDGGKAALLQQKIREYRGLRACRI